MNEQETIAAGNGTLDPLVVRLSDSVTILHGDCLHLIPSVGKVDAVITDPPYSSGGMVVANSHTGVGI